VEDTCKELQRIVLRSYNLSELQNIVKWFDHPSLDKNKPSVLMNQLNTLQPSSIEEVQKILFLRKMPAYIHDMINLKDFQDLPALKDQCNEIWESRSQDLAAMAVAAVIPRQHSQAQQLPVAHARPCPRRPRRRLLFLPRPLRLPRQEVQDRLHIPGKRVGWRWSPAPLPPAPSPLLTPPPSPTDTMLACATAMSILNAKNLI
jgi:hypothetical protein